MGNSKRMLRRTVSSLRGKTNRLHALIVATRRGGVFISESDAIRCVALIDWKAADVSGDHVSGVLFLEKGQDLCLETICKLPFCLYIDYIARKSYIIYGLYCV